MEEFLFSAISSGNLELVQNLLSVNPKLVSIRDKDDDTPLHRACTVITSNQLQIVLLLLEFGANIDAYGCSSRTPLHCATYEQNPALVRLLLEKGASMYEEDSLNENPLHKAADKGNEEIMRALLFKLYVDGGIKIPYVKESLNMQNVLGNTPLHSAADRGHLAVIKMLLEFGADPAIEDSFGLYAYQVASNRRFRECAELLQAVTVQKLNKIAQSSQQTAL